jgi:hypothetical protein
VLDDGEQGVQLPQLETATDVIGAAHRKTRYSIKL